MGDISCGRHVKGRMETIVQNAPRTQVVREAPFQLGRFLLQRICLFEKIQLSQRLADLR
jgi:hypothetical protein